MLLKALRYLPIPQSLRLAWRKRLIDRHFQKEIAWARQRKDPDVERLEYDHWYELQMVNEDQDQWYTYQLLRKANRLRVPVPPMPKMVKDE